MARPIYILDLIQLFYSEVCKVVQEISTTTDVTVDFH